MSATSESGNCSGSVSGHHFYKVNDECGVSICFFCAEQRDTPTSIFQGGTDA